MGKRVIIMGAAGRDFHNFNMLFKDDPGCQVVAFTAAQIPFIHARTFPPALSGPLYPEGIPIYPEDELPSLIKRHKAEAVVFSYSDVSFDYVMHRAALSASLGADFILPGAERTMLSSRKPVISVCAVRTGCGKSGVTRYIGRLLLEKGVKTVVIRHPMPYGDLARQRTQRFSTYDDMRSSGCTIEEMEEYEGLIETGLVVYAGVDYKEVLAEAEKEAEVIIWDGGNNDLPFIRPGLEIVLADPLRPGHELGYYPGEANLRRAGCVVINKADSATKEAVASVTSNIKSVNPSAKIVRTASRIKVDGDIKGKKVLVVEDGPTLTHGGMAFGAGAAAARAYGATPVDVRPYAMGSIREALIANSHLEGILPAMGYSDGQIKELEETINRTPADLVLIATPIDLAKLIEIKKPSARVRYWVEEMEEPGLKGAVEGFLKGNL